MFKKEEISIIEKPDDISYDEIHELLWMAHEENRRKGIFMRYPSYTGKELKELIGVNGKTFVALDNNKLIGTCSFKLVKRSRWYAKGQNIAYFLLEGVLPSYEGKGIYAQLCIARQKYLESLGGCTIIDIDTAEENIHSQNILKKNGFKYVDYGSSSFGHHYFVVMAKWFGRCPYSDRYIHFRYIISRLLTKVQYKRGRIERSRILSFLCRKMNGFFNRFI